MDVIGINKLDEHVVQKFVCDKCIGIDRNSTLVFIVVFQT